MTDQWWWNDALPAHQLNKDYLRYVAQFVPDIKAFVDNGTPLPPFEQIWRGMFGNAAKGVHTLKAYYAYLHGVSLQNWTNAQHNAFIVKQMAWFKQNSGPDCLYNTVFAWNTNPHWKTEDISHPDSIGMINWMQTEQHTVTPIGVTPPDEDPPVVIPPALTPDPASVTLTPTRIKGLTNGVNVRSKPTVKATVISNTALDEWVTVPMSEAHWQADTYNWRFVILPDGKQGFVASTVIGIELPVIDFTDAERGLIAAWRDGEWASVLLLLKNPLLFQLGLVESGLINQYRNGTKFDVIRWLLDSIESEQGD
jgi:hypothetical protein